MKKSRFTEEQMVAILREADQAPVPEDEEGIHDRLVGVDAVVQVGRLPGDFLSKRDTGQASMR